MKICAVTFFHLTLYILNRPISQIPHCTCPISHNALFRTKMCALFSEWCIMGNGIGALWDLRIRPDGWSDSLWKTKLICLKYNSQCQGAIYDNAVINDNEISCFFLLYHAPKYCSCMIPAFLWWKSYIFLITFPQMTPSCKQDLVITNLYVNLGWDATSVILMPLDIMVEVSSNIF